MKPQGFEGVTGNGEDRDKIWFILWFQSTITKFINSIRSTVICIFKRKIIVASIKIVLLQYHFRRIRKLTTTETAA
jgi:hypothetical protein